MTFLRTNIIKTARIASSLDVSITLTLYILRKFHDFCRLLTFFQNDHFKTIFQGHDQSIKQFGSRSGPTLCRVWSGSKLFAKIISRR